jgi:hypothetical protein
MFPLNKVKVVEKVFLDQVSGVKIIVMGKQKAYFQNVIPDTARGISLGVQNIGKF